MRSRLAVGVHTFLDQSSSTKSLTAHTLRNNQLSEKGKAGVHMLFAQGCRHEWMKKQGMSISFCQTSVSREPHPALPRSAPFRSLLLPLLLIIFS